MPNTSLNWRAAFQKADALPPTASPTERAARGRAFERILSGMFEEAQLRPRLSYRPKGEEIDGSIWLDGRTILVEAKWTADPHPASSLYQFKGKVDGKLVGTIGLFVSMSGFSPDAVNALVAGKELNIILAEGDDVRAFVDSKISIRSGLRKKLRAAGDSGTPLLPLDSGAASKANMLRPLRLVIVEGTWDVAFLKAAQRAFGVPETGFELVAAGGTANFAPLAASLIDQRNVESITAIVDEDVDDRTAKRLRTQLEEVASGRGIESQLVLVRPTLASALGVEHLDRVFVDRSRMHRPSNTDLGGFLTPSEVRQRASSNSSLRTALDAVGVPQWG